MILEYRGSSCETAVYNQSTSVDVFFNRSILAAFHAGSSHGVAAVPVFALSFSSASFSSCSYFAQIVGRESAPWLSQTL